MRYIPVLALLYTMSLTLFFGIFLIMTTEITQFYPRAQVLLLLCMSGVTLCLMAEYRSLREQTQLLKRVVQKKQDKESDHEHITSAQQGNKRVFIKVTRDLDSLAPKAIAFAKQHALEQAVKKLYQKEPQEDKEQKKRKHEKRAIAIKTAKRTKKESTPKKGTRDRQQRAYKNYTKQAKRTMQRARRVAPVSKAFAEIKKRVRLQWPLGQSQYWISSPYGPRMKPDKQMGFHTGIDLAAIKGTPVKAAAAGIVEEARYDKGYGNMVLLAHEIAQDSSKSPADTVSKNNSSGKLVPEKEPKKEVCKTRYAHCTELLVQANQRVKAGEIIATVGNTGNVRASHRKGDGSHLHFEVYVPDKEHNGLIRVNPLVMLP